MVPRPPRGTTTGCVGTVGVVIVVPADGACPLAGACGGGATGEVAGADTPSQSPTSDATTNNSAPCRRVLRRWATVAARSELGDAIASLSPSVEEPSSRPHDVLP